MVKGPARNAQFFFTTEYVMPHYGKRSFMEALPIARELWKKMSDLEKAPYKKKEQDWKTYMRGPAGDRYRKDCSGNNMQEELDRQKEKEEFEEFVRQEALNYIKPRGEVLEQPFFFIGFEFALEDDYGKYYPIEIGLVKYTLKNGIEKYVHYFLKPGEYPLGTKAAAKKHCEERHKIPYMGFDRCTDGYSAVFAHIRDTLLNTNSGASCDGASGGYPPIFCMPNDIKMVRRCLNDLFDRAGRHESERIKVVISASLLLIELFGSEVCGEAKALEILSSTAFDHEKGVACDWHYDQECINCALATARKIGFALSDALKTTFNLQLTPNHLPTVVQFPALPPTAELIPFEAPRSKKTWKSGGSSVVSAASSRDGPDSVVSSYTSRVERRNPGDNFAKGFSALSLGVGRGQSSYTAPPSRPGPNEVPFDDDDGERFGEEEWTTVSSHHHQNRNARDNNSYAPVNQQPTWERPGDDWGAPASTSVAKGANGAAWDDGDDFDYSSRSKPQTAQVASSSNAWVQDDDDDWEGVSVTSSTARPTQSAVGWGGSSNGSSVVSSNPYARAPAVGRGRALSSSRGK